VVLSSSTLIGIVVGILGCFVGIAGFLSSCGKDLQSDGVWRGSVDTNFQYVIANTNGIKEEICAMKKTTDSLMMLSQNHETRIDLVERDVDALKKGGTINEH